MSKRTVTQIASSLFAVASLAACATTGELTEQEALAAAVEEALEPATPEEIAAANRADPLTKANFWGREHQKDPTDLQVAISFGEALRGINSHQRAYEVATETLLIHPDNQALQMIVGRSLTKLGDHGPAAQAFQHIASKNPNNANAWAALGASYDQLGFHGKAQTVYRTALNIEPNRTSTLANLGLSLAISGDLAGAEAQLRRAASQQDASFKVKENFALILGLQGKYNEMRQVAAEYSPDAKIDANIAALRSMISTSPLAKTASTTTTAATRTQATTPAPQSSLRLTRTQ